MALEDSVKSGYPVSKLFENKTSADGGGSASLAAKYEGARINDTDSLVSGQSDAV